MSKYKNGKIYMLEPITTYERGDVYYGSTTQPLFKRFSQHKYVWNCKSRELFIKYGINNIKIVLIKYFSCNSRKELEIEEGQFIKGNKCINIKIPRRQLDKEKANKYDYITRKEGITNAEILEDDKDYNILINKQKEGNLSKEETYILDKYMLSKIFFIHIDKIDEEFIKLHFRKEYIIDNYKKFNSKEPVKKDLDNNLLSEKIDKINKIFKMFKEHDGDKKELKAYELRKKLIDFLKNPYLRNLFKTLPTNTNPREIFKNVEKHILDQLGMCFIKKRRRYRDEITGKRKEEDVYNVGYGKILNDYIQRKQEKEELF